MKKLFLFSLSSCLALTAMAQSSVTTGGSKYVVVEDVTGAWCQYCPDGTVYLNNVMAANPKVIGAAMHNGSSTSDKMTFADGNAVQAAPNVVCGYPGGLFDRKNWNGQYTGSSTCTTGPSVSRSFWGQLATQETALAPTWDVTVQHTYDVPTRTINITLTAKSLVAQTGKFSFNAWIIEDSVIGPDVQGYNQVNAYNTQSGHAYYQKGNPLKNFVHRHVERAFLGGAWGTAGVIPANAPANGTYTKTYSYVVPVKYDMTTTGAPNTRLDHISIIGMVMRDTTAKFERAIMNAIPAHLVGFPTSVSTIPAAYDLTVFPNPAQNTVTVKGILNKPGAVKVTFVNALGQNVLEQNYNYTASLFGEIISIDKLSNGIYFMNLSANGSVTTEKVIVNR